MIFKNLDGEEMCMVLSPEDKKKYRRARQLQLRRYGEQLAKIDNELVRDVVLQWLTQEELCSRARAKRILKRCSGV